MPKMFSANPRVSRTDNSSISSSSNNKMITRSARLSQLTKSSKFSVNRTLGNTFGPSDIYLSSYTIFVNMPIGTEIARISSTGVNSFSFTYTVNDTSRFYIEGDKLYTNTVFTDRINYTKYSVVITYNDAPIKYSKSIFLYFQQPPKVANIVNPVIINYGSINTLIDLTNTFTDVNDDVITITAIPYNPELLSIIINDNILTINYNQTVTGSSIIKLIARDIHNESVYTYFSIVVLPNNVDYNVTVNELPASLPKPIDDGLTSYTLLDSTYINILIDDITKTTEQENRDNVRSNISAIMTKYVISSQSETILDLYIPIGILPLPQLSFNTNKVRIIDSFSYTAENPLEVNFTNNIENSAMYINTILGNKVIVNLSNDILTIEQLTRTTFSVSINSGESEIKDTGEFVTVPTSEIVIILSSLIILENHAPVAYDINYTIIEDSIQNVIELEGYDVDENENSYNYIQYVIETLPQYGTLNISQNTPFINKQINYTPNDNYFGNDTLSYHVIDKYGIISNTATIGITVTNVDDLAIGTLTMTGTVEEGGTLSYSSTISDIDGPITFTYQWQISENDIDWDDIEGANERIYAVPSDQSLVDKYIRITAITTDSNGGKTNVVSNSSQVINVDDLATGVLSISGIVEEGGTISYISDINDVDGNLTFTYQWQISENNIDWMDEVGSTGISYNISSSQDVVGKYIRITAVSTDSRGGKTNFVSESSQIQNVNDIPSGNIYISGYPGTGRRVYADTNNINDEDGQLYFEYRWVLDGRTVGNRNYYDIPSYTSDERLILYVTTRDPNNNRWTFSVSTTVR